MLRREKHSVACTKLFNNHRAPNVYHKGVCACLNFESLVSLPGSVGTVTWMQSHCLSCKSKTVRQTPRQVNKISMLCLGHPRIAKAISKPDQAIYPVGHIHDRVLLRRKFFRKRRNTAILDLNTVPEVEQCAENAVYLRFWRTGLRQS